jgi:hypothetical protein
MQAIALEAVGVKQWAALLSLTLLLPLGITMTALRVAGPGGNGGIVLAASLAAFVLTTLVLGGALCRHSAQVERRSLRIATSFYTVALDASDLSAGAQEILPGEAASVPRIGFRTNGVALPGYRSGWYRSAAGKHKLFAAVVGTPNLYIPTTAGFDVLLTVSNPKQAIDQISKLVRDERQNNGGLHVES